MSASSDPADWLTAVWNNYNVPLLLGGVSLLCLVISLILLVTSIQSTKPIEFGHVSETSHNIDPSRRLGESSQNKSQYNTASTTDSSDRLSQDGSDAMLISINSASQFELELLPGVGPVTAQKIIDNRPYETLEELVIKKAVGQKLFEKIKQYVSL